MPSMGSKKHSSFLTNSDDVLSRPYEPRVPELPPPHIERKMAQMEEELGPHSWLSESYRSVIKSTDVDLFSSQKALKEPEMYGGRLMAGRPSLLTKEGSQWENRPATHHSLRPVVDAVSLAFTASVVDTLPPCGDAFGDVNGKHIISRAEKAYARGSMGEGAARVEARPQQAATPRSSQGGQRDRAAEADDFGLLLQDADGAE